MTFGERVKTLRIELGLSQLDLGTRGFVSAAGWIKVENGQRQASEKLIDALLQWLVSEKHVRAGGSKSLREELLTLKYMGSNSPFLRDLARKHAVDLPNGAALLVKSEKVKPRRGRPVRRR